jgi:hypothetical protein
MDACKPITTPLDLGARLSKSQSLSSIKERKMASIPYKKVVNSVMYYMVNTRPNIVAILGIIVQFFNNLRLLHCQVIKQLLRYLQGIQNLAL